MMARVTAPTRWPEARGTRGMVAAPHVLAAEAGRAMFTAGGQALGSPIPWKRLLEDAVRHARVGFAVSPGQRRVTAGADALFAASAPAEVRSSFWPVYHPDRFADGRFVQADLAATLAAVSEGGDEEFYRGDLARRIVAGAHAVGSPLTLGDLAEHRADWVEPLRVRYRHGR